MRQDTRTLLERLKRDGSFQYVDFDDASADGDVWPMFEALLGDPRVVGDGAVDMTAFDTALVIEPSRAAAAPPPPSRLKGGLFRRYADQASPAPVDTAEPSIRDVLDNLAQVG